MVEFSFSFKERLEKTKKVVEIYIKVRYNN